MNSITNILSVKKITIAAFILSGLIIIALPYLIYMVIGVLFLSTLTLINKKFYPPISIVIFLTISSDIDETLRTIANTANIMLLFLYYFKEYGLSLKKVKELQKDFIFFIFLVFFSLILSTLFSKSINTGIIEIARQALFFVVVFIYYSLIKNKEDLFLNLKAIIISALLISGSIIFNFITSDTAMYLLQSEGVIREGGLFKNVTAAGNIIATAIQLLIFYYLVSNSKKEKYYIIVLTSFLLIALLLTNSRASMLSAIISSIIIMFWLKPVIAKRTIVVSIVVILLLVLNPYTYEMIDKFFRLGRVLENTRYIIWDMTIKIIIENPFFGTGPGMFKDYMYSNLPVMIGSWNEEQIRFIHDYAGAGHSHNFFLYRTAELGILGFITAFLLPFLFFRYGSKILKSAEKTSSEYILTIILISSVIGALYRSLFESTGLLTNGWITRDLNMWIIFLSIIYLYNKINRTKRYLVVEDNL